MSNIFNADCFKYFFDGDTFNIALIVLSIWLTISLAMLPSYFYYIKLIGE